jgi:hypothetical protein
MITAIDCAILEISDRGCRRRTNYRARCKIERLATIAGDGIGVAGVAAAVAILESRWNPCGLNDDFGKTDYRLGRQTPETRAMAPQGNMAIWGSCTRHGGILFYEFSHLDTVCFAYFLQLLSAVYPDG